MVVSLPVCTRAERAPRRATEKLKLCSQDDRTPDIKLFGKRSTDDVQINDISLQDNIAVKEKYAKYLPRNRCPTVEHLTNSMMMHGRSNGEKLVTVRIVKYAFDFIHLLTGENPLQLLAVDMSPLRQVNQAIWLLGTGVSEAAFQNIQTSAECLADELISATKGSSNSYAIGKEDELAHVAKSNS
ncbi:ribosomal protein S5 [Saguinus oedipus]|uniref:Ribosomal protein S5 n=1 Tax=Saguinus oedipus TaxID=9490 RepID=A0ABQ9VKB5_SAGOE|nr:ribosomal protein S5 [Saguinus oedipus]